MQRVLAFFGKALRQSFLVLGLVSLLSLPGLFMQQPSYAGTASVPNAKINQVNPDKQSKQSVEDREEAYENMAKAARSPQGLEQEYEKNLEVYEDQQPNQGLVEGAKSLVEKVTGNE